MTKEIISATHFCIMTFLSTQHALRAERVLEEQDINNFVIVPTPRELTSSCGLSIKFFCDQKSAVKETVVNAGILIDGIYDFKKQINTNHSIVLKLSEGESTGEE